MQLINEIINKDLKSALITLNQLYQNSAQPKMIMEQLIMLFRNLLIALTVKDFQSLIGCLDDELEFYNSKIQSITIDYILKNIHILSSKFDNISNSMNQRIELEMTIIELVRDDIDMSIPSILEKINKISVNQGPTTNTIIQKADVVKEKTESVKKENTVIKESKLAAVTEDNSAIEPFKEWGEVIKHMMKINPAIHGAVRDSEGYIKGNTVLIDSKNEILFKILRENKMARDSLRQSIQMVTGVLYKLGPLKKEDKENNRANEDSILNSVIENAKNNGITYIEK